MRAEIGINDALVVLNLIRLALGQHFAMSQTINMYYDTA